MFFWISPLVFNLISYLSSLNRCVHSCVIELNTRRELPYIHALMNYYLYQISLLWFLSRHHSHKSYVAQWASDLWVSEMWLLFGNIAFLLRNISFSDLTEHVPVGALSWANVMSLNPPKSFGLWFWLLQSYSLQNYLSTAFINSVIFTFKFSLFYPHSIAKAILYLNRHKVQLLSLLLEGREKGSTRVPYTWSSKDLYFKKKILRTGLNLIQHHLLFS